MGTVVTAHRGFSGQYPENTLAAFEAAIAIGCDLIEFDVRGTADHVPVILHDVTLERTSDGQGPISDMSLVDVKKLNASFWQGSHNEGRRLNQALSNEVRIPTLEELLSLVKGRIGLNIQIYDTSSKVMDEICKLYASYDLYKQGYLSLSTFEEAELVRAIDKDIEICVLERQHRMDRSALLELKKFGCTYIQPTRADASIDFCIYAKELGLYPSMFYSNTVEDNEKYIAMGMPGILTDHPDLLVQET